MFFIIGLTPEDNVSTLKVNFPRILFIILTALVLLSCSLFGGGSDDRSDSPGKSSAVGSLTDVKSAVIQIEAQGTFVDPDFGEYSGAGTGTGLTPC